MSADERGDEAAGAGGGARGSTLEHEFRAMFAERSEAVRASTAPYAAVRRRIIEGRRRRGLRIGGAGLVFAVAAAGIGVWAWLPGPRHEAVGPAAPGPAAVGTPAHIFYADGHTELPAGLRDTALTWLRSRYHGDLSGATVVTTFDQSAQTAADAKASPGDAGVAVLDCRTGDVLALGGTWDRQLQIASLVRPILLAAAFDSWHASPETREPLDTQRHPLFWPEGAPQPMTYANPAGDQMDWPPEPPTATIRDEDVSLVQAAESDANGPFAQLGLTSGITLPSVVKLAVEMGMPEGSPDLIAMPSLVLGVPSASPLTMATVYATIADGGVRHDPRLVAKVVSPSGATLWTPSGTGTRVLSQNTAQEVAGVLHQALTSGTTGTGLPAATRADPGAWAMAGGPDTGKSAWFDGGDGNHVIAVGLSSMNTDGTLSPITNDHASGPSVGSRLAGPLWAGMAQVLRNLK